jgi:hypothetical protein
MSYRVISSDFRRKAREIFYTVTSTFIGIHFIFTFLDSRFHGNDIVYKTFTTTSDQGELGLFLILKR